MPRVGSTSTRRRLRANRKNWPNTVRRRARVFGNSARNASISAMSTSAQSCLLRWVSRKQARSRTVANADSMVRSARGRVPARRARSRARSMDSAKTATAARIPAGAPSIRFLRRPAASRWSWSVAIARPRWVKNVSRARASDPIDRPGRRARSSMLCGWLGCSSSSNRDSVVISTQARPGQWWAARYATKSSSQSGGSVSRAASVSPRTNGRSGWRCQHRPHMPRPAWRRNSPQLAQMRGGSFAGPGREHEPHHPVASRR